MILRGFPTKKIGALLLAITFSLLSTTTTLAVSNWGFSVADTPNTGYFDYRLYYPNSLQVISKVTLPQNQNLVVLSGKYSLDSGYYIKLLYGDTGLSMKGRGSDSDWTVQGSDTLTYYGDMDAYGSQKTFSVDLGTTLIETDLQKVTVFWGWGKQETANELRNVIYHLVDGVNVGNQTQADNGSALNGEFSGFYIGAADDVAINSNLGFEFGLTLFQVNAKAYGHWANHSPAWNWVDTGSAIGYKVKAGCKYTFNQHFLGQVGYQYYYAEADNCVEMLNGSILPQTVDLKYEQKGFYFNLIYMF